MAMVNVVTVDAYGRIYCLRLIGLVQGRRPPGAACYIRLMNRVNSRSDSALLRWQHHKHCRYYYYYYYGRLINCAISRGHLPLLPSAGVRACNIIQLWLEFALSAGTWTTEPFADMRGYLIMTDKACSTPHATMQWKLYTG